MLLTPINPTFLAVWDWKTPLLHLLQVYWVANLERKQLAHTFYNLGQLLISGNSSILRNPLRYSSTKETLPQHIKFHTLVPQQLPVLYLVLFLIKIIIRIYSSHKRSLQNKMINFCSLFWISHFYCKYMTSTHFGQNLQLYVAFFLTFKCTSRSICQNTHE